jgi:hypothetical protein
MALGALLGDGDPHRRIVSALVKIKNIYLEEPASLLTSLGTRELFTDWLIPLAIS